MEQAVMARVKERTSDAVAADRYRWQDHGFSDRSEESFSRGLEGEARSPLGDEIERGSINGLKRCLRTRSLTDQELLALRFEVGLSYRQIAQVMRMSETDVRFSICTMLLRLQEAAKATDGNPADTSVNRDSSQPFEEGRQMVPEDMNVTILRAQLA